MTKCLRTFMVSTSGALTRLIAVVGEFGHHSLMTLRHRYVTRPTLSWKPIPGRASGVRALSRLRPLTPVAQNCPKS